MQQLVAELHDEETVVLQDEVELHVNPKIGCQWIPRGEQAEVVTPGNNEKRHLPGSLHWRTCTLLPPSHGTRRDSQLFLTHLDDLRCRHGQFRKLHLIRDNARFHNCRAVREWLARWQRRIELHLLRRYAPETNPMERVWWHLHETITRNHRSRTFDERLREICPRGGARASQQAARRTLDELLREIYQWAAAQGTFYEQTRNFHTRYKTCQLALR